MSLFSQHVSKIKKFLHTSKWILMAATPCIRASLDIHTRIQCLRLCCRTLFIPCSYNAQNGVHLALEMSIVANCVSANTKCLCSAPNHWHAMIQWTSSLVSELYLCCLMDLALPEPSASMTRAYYFRSVALLRLFSHFFYNFVVCIVQICIHKLSSFERTRIETPKPHKLFASPFVWCTIYCYCISGVDVRIVRKPKRIYQ